MGVFSSEKQFTVRPPNLGWVAEDVAGHFRAQGFEVACEEALTGGWHIDLHRGGLFKAALGMKTSLKLELHANDGGTLAKAGVGIFGAQAVPTAIMLLVAWPVLLTQIWGMVRQAHLDDEALRVVEASLQQHVGEKAKANGARQFCTKCGHAVETTAKFCGECGHRAR